MVSTSVRRDSIKSYADLVLRNGAIYTVNELNPWAQAVGIRGKKIVFVGAEEQISDWIGPKTKVIDLR